MRQFLDLVARMDSQKEGSDKSKKNNDEKCFKWAVIAALHHEDIKRISLLQHDKEKCNWNGFESPLVIQKLG